MPMAEREGRYELCDFTIDVGWTRFVMKGAPFNLVQGVSVTKIAPLDERCERAIRWVLLRVVRVTAA